MPELAEVETLRRGVESIYMGRRVVTVGLGSPRTIRRHPDPGDFRARLEGRTFTSAGRRGKYLVIGLDGPESLVMHMGMSGQLLSVPPGSPAVKHTHLALGFHGGPDLRFVDPRTFGQAWLAATTEKGVVAGLEGLGPDPIADRFPAGRLATMLAARRTRLKPLLMDQRFIAGIGNMYADEILFTARLSGDRPAAGLDAAEVRRLHRAMVRVLSDAIDHRGSSLADEQYRDLYGEVGDYQKLHNVYARPGSPCPRCATPIARSRYAGRSNYFCPSCQVPQSGGGGG